MSTSKTPPDGQGYQAVKDYFRQRILNGTWRAGERLPTLTATSRQFGVNYNTVQRAISELQREGFVAAHGRHGCFVSDGWTSRPAAWQGNAAGRPSLGQVRVGMTVHWSVEAEGTAGSLVLLERLLTTRLCQEGGALLRIRTDNLDPQAGEAALQPLLGDPPVQVVVVTGSVAGPLLPTICAWLQKLGRRVIACWGTQGAELPGDAVTIDDAWAFRDAVAYLVRLGHRHIAFAGVDEDDPYVRQWLLVRHAAWRQALRDHGLPTGPEYSLRAGSSAAPRSQLDCGAAAAAELVPGACTALVCANDNVARGAICGLRARGLRVPEDVSVIGYDNHSDDLVQRELTTYTLPDERIAEALLSLIAMRAAGQSELGDRTHIVLRPILVPRSSCREARP